MVMTANGSRFSTILSFTLRLIVIITILPLNENMHDEKHVLCNFDCIFAHDQSHFMVTFFSKVNLVSNELFLFSVCLNSHSW